MLTQGSHFDGIAGFPLAGALNGIKAVWATEIEEFPIMVSRAHFPDMKHYGSITEVSGADLEPVDIITFGSPCQDLSVAGKRVGLEGERSGLFMDAVRTIREMREATGGLYPRIAVWENVPGALSGNNGRDFRAVLEEIAEAEIPIPASGRWAEAGMVRGNGREIAWRCLDAQYWGVPQHRKRIFLVCDFRGERAGEILFERQGLPGHPAPCRETRQEAPGNTRGGAKKPSRYFQNTGHGWWNEGDIAATIRTPCGGDSIKANLITDEVISLMGPIAFGPGKQHEIAHALRSQPSKADKPSSTTYIIQNEATMSDPKDPGHRPAAFGGTGGNNTPVTQTGCLVRRLTPKECERLQGFPDNWTDIQLTGRKKHMSSDTARYKALGNSVAVPCVEWIMRRIKGWLHGRSNDKNEADYRPLVET
jgi:DNA (cytosine-5)-methyltransferase 1